MIENPSGALFPRLILSFFIPSCIDFLERRTQIPDCSCRIQVSRTTISAISDTPLLRWAIYVLHNQSNRLLTGRSTTGNKVSFALRRVQVNPTVQHIIPLVLILVAWELTEFEFLSGTPLSVLINQTSQAGNLNLSSIPAPDPRTSEDCLFLDVLVPKSIFDSKATKDSKRNSDSDAGEFIDPRAPTIC
jgi:hypothetical protein